MSVATEAVRALFGGGVYRHPIPPMDGALVPDSRLDGLPTVDIPLVAPDDISSDGFGNLLISDGKRLLVARWDGETTVLAEFESVVSAFTRLADGTWVVALDDDGLRHLDVSGQELAASSRLGDLPLAGITALADDGQGGVYFTVGSTRHTAGDWVWDLMEGNRDGLLGHWAIGHEPECLDGGLAFPNGILVVADRSRLLVTESWTHSITAYPIEGARLGRPWKLIDNMIGYPARISSARDGGYWLAMFALRTQLVELTLRDKRFKRDMMRSLGPELWVCPTLSSTGSHMEPLQMGGMKALGVHKAWAPPRSYGLVIKIASNGDIVESLHSRAGGRRHGITAVREIGDNVYIVCKGSQSLLVTPVHQPMEAGT